MSATRWLCLICGQGGVGDERPPACFRCGGDSVMERSLVKAAAETRKMLVDSGLVIDMEAVHALVERLDPAPRTYDLWMEGSVTTGHRSQAAFLGREQGTSFKDACETFASKHSWFSIRFDAAKLMVWGCKLFDNEDDARKSFG